MKGVATKGNTITYGSYGLVAQSCGWITSNQIEAARIAMTRYIKRGGRVSAATAVVGSMLAIKPLLHVDDEGHLVPVTKVRGRKTSISTIADMYGELAKDKEGGLVYISHGACENDANALATMLNERYGAKVSIITDVGTVIGAHSGPGTLALFFIGTHR